MKSRWWFPVSLALCHAVLTVLVFLQAIRNPDLSGLLPIVVFGADLPFSFVIIVLSRVIHPRGYAAGLLTDMSFFLVLGSLWWFGIGYVIVLGIGKVAERVRRSKSSA